MYWSRGFYELLGLNPDTVAPSYEEFNQRIHPEDRRSEHDVDYVLGEREFRVIWPNGRLRWVHSQAEMLLNTAGEPVKVVGVGRDHTKSHESLQVLRAAGERYAALI